MSNKFLFTTKFIFFIRLVRLDQPIGFFLLLWPTLWGLWFSSKGIPDLKLLVVFVMGVLCMRSAGCVINDYVDYKFDSLVQRTKNRPLSTGEIKKKEACIIFILLLVIALILDFFLNFITIILSLVAFLLLSIYPYLKRCFCLPQLMLGILFSWPILMTFTEVNYSVNETGWLLFIMNFIWAIIYDTQYSMMDRKDDQYIGIKSSAILFGDMDRLIIGILQFLVVFFLCFIGWKENLSVIYYSFSLVGVVILFIRQQILIYSRECSNCFKAFLNNNFVGMFIFLGIFLSFL